MNLRPHRAWILLPALGALLAGSAAAAAAAGPAGDGVATARGRAAMVVSAHPLASEAGREILRAGGNAVDAAVATAFALAVVEPYSSGVGGGGFAVTFTAATGATRSLDFRETAPAAAARDMFLVAGRADSALSRRGALAVAVPGLVRGLWELHRECGRLPWRRLLAPAELLAREGFVVTPLLAETIAEVEEHFNPAAREIFLPGGAPPQPGDLLRQTDLAAVLAAVAEEGPDAFYAGDVARALVAAVRAGGGILAPDDLAGFAPRWREPIRGRYRGLEVLSMPPPSSGGVHLLQMLNILEGLSLPGPFACAAPPCAPEDLQYEDDAVCHLLIETMKFAFADRSRWLGDPDFVDVPVARLTSRGYADSLRARIAPDRALPWRELDGAPVVPPEGDDTSHLSVVDAAGDAVAMTLTINLHFGAGLVAAGTGVVLNDEMDDFVAAPGTPNAFGLVGDEANSIAAGKRPLSSMTPVILLRDGRVFLVAGSPGGSKIISTVLQVVLNVVDFGMSPAAALAAPRLHQQWYPPATYHEPLALTRRCARRLEARGHELRHRAPLGNVQLIVVDPRSGELIGASDPRGEGAPRGY